MKLEVGMYVRTEWGTIQKIKEKRDYYKCIADENGEEVYYLNINQSYQDYELIIKASHNIINLIEVGDYVNGYYVEDVFDNYVNVSTGSNYFQKPSINADEIKSIVTKEQFEQMQYKVDN